MIVIPSLLQLNWRLYTEIRSLTVTCDAAAAAVVTDVAYWLAKATSWGCFKKVETLHLYGNRIGDDGLRVLASCFAEGAFPRLRCLDLSWNDLTDTAALALAEVLARRGSDGKRVVLPELRELTVERNQLGVEGSSALIHSLAGKKGDKARLTTLNLSSNGQVGKSGMMQLAVALHSASDSLRALSLNYCNIDDRGARALSTSLSKLQSLRRLDLEGNLFGNAGASALAEALTSGGLSGLEALNLKSNCFSDSGVVALSAALRTGSSPSLSCLDLSGNGIACEGAVALAMVIAGGHCSLQSLSLAWNNLSDEGATAFAANVDVKTPLPHSSQFSLEKLDMGNNSIGDLGVRALAHAFRSAAPLSQLQQIDLTGNDFHDGGLSDLVAFMRDAMEGVKTRVHKVAVYNGISLDQLVQPDVKAGAMGRKARQVGGAGEVTAGAQHYSISSRVDKTERGLFMGMAGFLMFKLCSWAWNVVVGY